MMHSSKSNRSLKRRWCSWNSVCLRLTVSFSFCSSSSWRSAKSAALSVYCIVTLLCLDLRGDGRNRTCDTSTRKPQQSAARTDPASSCALVVSWPLALAVLCRLSYVPKSRAQPSDGRGPPRCVHVARERFRRCRAAFDSRRFRRHHNWGRTRQDHPQLAPWCLLVPPGGFEPPYHPVATGECSRHRRVVPDRPMHP